MKTDLNFEIFPEEQKQLFDILSKMKWISNFYLAGGTALALQIEHRQSIDFDFFTSERFDSAEIVSNITDIGRFELFTESESTINGMLNDVRISFFKYKYPLINKTINHKNIRIANPLDIAAMKLEAISGRGSKKDFIDLYFLLKIFGLHTIFKAYQDKYNFDIINNYHLQKSLIYFADAVEQPMPIMIEKLSWEDVKSFVTQIVKESQFKNSE